MINSSDRRPIEYVNIGIPGKNIGTVSDEAGKFGLVVDPRYDTDSVLFSIIGFEPQAIAVSELRATAISSIKLKEKVYELTEVVIQPKDYRTKTLGVTSKSKKFSAGFTDNLLGYECGIRMSVKKTAIVKQVNINVSYCSYDTVFYRLNIYEERDKLGFKNILQEPIYILMDRELVKDEIQIDLRSKDISVDGDFLVTLEHIKDLGEGKLLFSAGLRKKTHFRKTSQGAWETAPVGISISVVADVEQ